MVTTDENYQRLGDFLLHEVRAKDSVKYPTLADMLVKLQASFTYLTPLTA